MGKFSSKKALLFSVLSMVICVSMLIGSTFAWFTDSATANVNEIKSGNLDIVLEKQNADGTWSEVSENTALDFLRKGTDGKLAEDANIFWEPGCTFELPILRIRNNGNLALKYQVVISGATGDTMLLDVIKFKAYVGNDTEGTAVNVNDGKPVAEGMLVPAEKADETNKSEQTIKISAHMDETANNDYKDLKVTGITITVVATQTAYEYDSTRNDYDADATFPTRVDGAVKADSDTVLKDKETDHNIKFTAPAGSLSSESESISKVSLVVDKAATPATITVGDLQSSVSYEVTLKDQNGKTVSASGEALFEVEMKVGTGLSGIKVYHDGVEMTNDGAALTEHADHFVYDSTTGYITMKVSHFSPFTAVYNKENWSDRTSEDYTVPVDEDGKVVTITSAAELAKLASEVNSGKSYKGYTVKLANDIDLGSHMWTPIGKSGSTFQGIFDGQGHTISNLLINSKWSSDVGLFGFTTNGEIKNFTLKNASVKGYLDVGAVAGTPYTSKYSNITLTGDVEIDGFAYVGGMFGKNAYANLTDLTIDVSEGSYVNADSGNYRTYVGGLVGFMGEGKQVVKNVTSNIDVTGSTCDVGGITGIAHYGNTFINCHSSGDVTLTSAQDEGDELEIGGIAGVWLNTSGQTVTLTGCTYTGKLSSNNVKTGAVTEFTYDGLVGNKYTRDSSVGTLIIN